MGKLDHLLSFSVNLSLHVFILLTFLSVFFFLYISKLTKSHVEHELDELITSKVNQLLTNLSNEDAGNYIDWRLVSNLTETLKARYSHELPELKRHNETLHKGVVCFLVIYATIALILTTYFYYKGFHLGLKFIFVENLIIFFFVGVIEFVFFAEIASKYIPVTPDTATDTVISRVKERLMNVR